MSESSSLSGDHAIAGLKKFVIDVEDVGPVSVFVEGDAEKMKLSSNVFLSLHTVGTSYKHWVNFNQQEDMREVANRAVFLHVALPGQRPGAPDLETFPSLDTIGMGLVNILDFLRVSRVLVCGDGAGANIALRFAAQHPSRVHGVFLVNPSAGRTTAKDNWSTVKNMVRKKSQDTSEQLNLNNVEKFKMANRQRTDILDLVSSRVNCDVLVITGAKSRMVEAGEAIHRELASGQCSIIKMEEGSDNPMLKATDKVAEAFVLFAQGLGLVPAARRKTSRDLISGSTSSSQEGLVVGMVGKQRKYSMEQADIPNISRLSIDQSSHQI
jgi:pimeloyl-ACP methyl ester carboxylesterase